MTTAHTRNRDRPLHAYLPGLSPVEEAVEQLANAGIEERGAVFTRPEVVNFILDLVGYTTNAPLHRTKLLEPSFGDGDFLLPAVTRLLDSYERHREAASGDIVADLHDCVRGVELHRASFEGTRQKLIALLTGKGVSARDAQALTEAWLIQGDFLLTEFSEFFTHVVGNPPYVRQERIPDALMDAYRKRFSTIYDRADLYIPFIEKSLRLLANAGVLGFICADRWMKNRYGGPLREMIARGFHLRAYVDMFNTPAFLADVIAYPAITVIANERPAATRIAHRPAIDAKTLAALSREFCGKHGEASGDRVKEVAGITRGSEPWILESSDQLALVRRLERDFPTLEEAGCSIGIGVATGADSAFIGLHAELGVEPDRKLPLVQTRDIQSGEVRWRGFGVVNPFNDDGTLVDLARYPKLKRYLEERHDQIAQRHVAQKVPHNWYRTIDRISPALTSVPKLLIPDIKGEAHIVYEEGRLYPHHNLYYITSNSWNLRALQGVLRSGIARLFVSTYSTKMHGGFLRFQAQYLRRIRLPRWDDVPETTKMELVCAAESGDILACNRAVFALYGLTKHERAALGGNGEQQA